MPDATQRLTNPRDLGTIPFGMDPDRTVETAVVSVSTTVVLLSTHLRSRRIHTTTGQ